MFSNYVFKIKKVLSEESCYGVEVVTCRSLNCCQHFFQQMTRLLRHKFWNKPFEEKTAHTLDISTRLHRIGDYSCVKFVMLQERDVCETIKYKIMGIFRSTYMITSRKTKKGLGFYHIEIRGVKNSKPQ